MIARDSDQALGGIVQMDDACWVGERHSGGVGRGSPGKTPFVEAVQCTPDGRPIAVRMDVLLGFRKKVLATSTQRHLVPGAAVVSDGLNCFPGVTDADRTHTAIATGGGAPDLGHPIFWWVNTMLGNVKNALHDTYHALRQKYLQRYLSEFCEHFNRRFDLAALVPRRMVAAAQTPPTSYRRAILDAWYGKS